MSNISKQMDPTWKEGNKLEGASSFKAWKNRIHLVLKKHEVFQYVQCKVPKLDKYDDEEKSKSKKGEVKALRIIF